MEVEIKIQIDTCAESNVLSIEVKKKKYGVLGSDWYRE